jgi:hypothetical protein
VWHFLSIHNPEKSCFWTWNTIEKMFLCSGDDVKSVLYESGVVKVIIERQHQLVGIKQPLSNQNKQGVCWPCTALLFNILSSLSNACVFP